MNEILIDRIVSLSGSSTNSFGLSSTNTHSHAEACTLTIEDIEAAGMHSFLPDDTETLEDCAICFEQTSPLATTTETLHLQRRLACSHTFHAACIDTWLTSRSASCPLCRTDFSDLKQLDIFTALRTFTSSVARAAATVYTESDIIPSSQQPEPQTRSRRQSTREEPEIPTPSSTDSLSASRRGSTARLTLTTSPRNRRKSTVAHQLQIFTNTVPSTWRTALLRTFKHINTAASAVAEAVADDEPEHAAESKSDLDVELDWDMKHLDIGVEGVDFRKVTVSAIAF